MANQKVWILELNKLAKNCEQNLCTCIEVYEDEMRAFAAGVDRALDYLEETEYFDTYRAIFYARDDWDYKRGLSLYSEWEKSRKDWRDRFIIKVYSKIIHTFEQV